MKQKEHHYNINLKWTGNEGKGTKNYRAYSRNHLIMVDGKSAEILGSSDPSFRGDASRYNPEDLFVSSLSACHMLWFLHLCAVNKVVVVDYVDEAIGIMVEEEDGSGKFKSVTLRPSVTVMEESMIEKANSLHHKANKMCFIANSCNFPIYHEAATKTIEL